MPPAGMTLPEQGKEAEQRLGWGPSVIGGVLSAEHPVRSAHGAPGNYDVAMDQSRGGAGTSSCRALCVGICKRLVQVLRWFAPSRGGADTSSCCYAGAPCWHVLV